MTLDDLDGRMGEGWGGEAPDGVHANLVLARRGTPTAAAAAGALASPSPGHTPILVCLGAGTLVRPATIMVNKTTIETEAFGRLTWGAGQLGAGQGVLDAVADGLFAPEEVGDVVLLLALWIDPAAQDETAVRHAARAAVRAAIGDALDPPDAAHARHLVDGRDGASNGFYSGR